MTSVAGHPAAYLRRSHVDPDSPGDISREVQRNAVRKLAAADGHNGDLVEYDDFGLSADITKSGRRTAYTQLLADMEAGRVSSLYAFDVDRLYRDPRDLIRLQDAAQAHHVHITTTSGRLAIGDGDDPAAEAFAFVGSVFNRLELQKAKKRAQAALEERRARGDRFGRPGYGWRFVREPNGKVILPVAYELDSTQPLETVLDAFAEAGSFSGAAKLLNARNVPSQRGKRWDGNTINRIIRRERPGLAPRGRVDARVAVRGSQTFSRLLLCHCGQVMTPRVSYTRTKYGTYGPYVGYQCFRGRHDAAHSRPYMVHESRILDWAKNEAARLRAPEKVQLAEQNTARRAQLEEQRRRLGWAVVDGHLDRDDAQARGAAIDSELEQLGDQEAVVDVPAVDWTWPPAQLNGVLRTLWESIELDEHMQPVRAEWRVPEWRA